jgi:FtsZ-binding cell division protein ZapB
MAREAVQTAESESDALQSLEDRIRRAAELVARLRAERDAAVSELASIRKSSGSAQAEVDKLREEVESMRSERAQVRARIEKLLGQIDLLSGS